MSAWQASHNHIDLLVKFAVNEDAMGVIAEIFKKPMSPQEFGDALLKQNKASLKALYGNRSKELIWWNIYTYNSTITNDVVREALGNNYAIITQCKCYNYQSRETNNYYGTKVSAAINYLISLAVDLSSEEYSNVRWGID